MSELLERVSAARTYLTAKVPFLGFMALRLQPRAARPGDQVPTAGVGPDGTLVLNEEFCEALTDQELRGLLAHEVLHPAMLFFERLFSKPISTWNIAHDYVINLIIMEFVGGRLAESIKLPKGGLLDSQYAGMSAEEVYESFPKECRDSEKGGMKLLISLGGKPGDDGDSGEGPGGGDSKPIGIDCRPDLSSTPDGRAAGKGDQAAQERLDRNWQIAIVAAAQVHEQQKGQGTLPGGLKLLIDQMLDPKIHWTDVLSRYLGEHAGQPDLTYQRPSRRSESVGEILIGRKRRNFPEITIFWDTSGSMHGEEKVIFPEVSVICEELGLRVRVIIIDTEIHNDLEDVQEAAEIAEALEGGGGSNFIPAFERLDEECNDSVVLAFTDGYIQVPETMPETLQDTLWIVTGGGVDPTDGAWGSVMRLDDDGNGSWG